MLPRVPPILRRCMPAVLLGAAAVSPADGTTGADRAEDARSTPQYGRDVRPILSERCFRCHGPDAAAREANLRLDVRAEATAPRRGGAAVVPGAPQESLLLERVHASDPELRMPPPDVGPALSPDELDVFERWISDGATYEEHWAYRSPRPAALPPAGPRARNEVDAFVQAALAERGLEPAARAEPRRLLRRVRYALTGLPPDAPELEAFDTELAARGLDAALDAAVERALGSDAYAEHWARRWLDVARYADTHGYHLDNERSMWPYRDWVIEAFGRNLPYDRFVLEQMAGDLLPDATVDTRIATGFHRCNPTTAEGGLIDAEYLAKYAFDRVETTATVFLGTTLGCARCHDHKFDPFTQEEYYALYSFFDDVRGAASDGNALAPEPTLRVAKGANADELARLEREAELAADELAIPRPDLDRAQLEVERAEREALERRFPRIRVLEAVDASDEPLVADANGRLSVGETVLDTDSWTLRLEAPANGLSALLLELGVGEDGKPGRSESGNLLVGELSLTSRGDHGARTEHALFAAIADFAQDGFPLSASLDGDDETGWAFAPEMDRGHLGVFAVSPPVEPGAARELELTLAFRSPHRQHLPSALALRSAREPGFAPPELGAWERTAQVEAAEREPDTSLLDTPIPDGIAWEAADVPATGEALTLGDAVGVTFLRRTLTLREPAELVVAFGSDDGLEIRVDGEVVHRNDTDRGFTRDADRVVLELAAGPHELLATVSNSGGPSAFGARLVSVRPADFDPLRAAALLTGDPAAPSARLQRAFRSAQDPAQRELYERAEESAAALEAFEAELPLALVLEQKPEPTPTFVLERGSYAHPGREVASDVPQLFGGLEPDAPRDRLGLARWLTSEANPLFERVFVNWIWQAHFGRGLVATPEDFGSQGAWPSHPDLLDWLCVRFRESGFDVAWLHRTILGSATWRQSSRADPRALAEDPENLLLARGPRVRLEAEELRDSVLAWSGLLVERTGGPPVRPSQPEGVWEAVAYPSSNTATYVPDAGEALHRRSLYTFWKRTAPPPNLVTFDAPTREACVMRRESTSTPLQALVLWNDEQVVEAARALAALVAGEVGTTAEQRAAHAFERVTSRSPDSDELDLVVELFEAQLEHFAGEPDAAAALAGEPELAAWTIVAGALFSLDEALHRG